MSTYKKSRQDIEEIVSVLNVNCYHFQLGVLPDNHYSDMFDIVDLEHQLVLCIRLVSYDKMEVYTNTYQIARLMFPGYIKNDQYKKSVHIGCSQGRTNIAIAQEILRRLIPQALENNKLIFDDITKEREYTRSFQEAVDRYKALHAEFKISSNKRNWDVNYSLYCPSSQEYPYVDELEVSQSGTCRLKLANVNEELAKKIIDLCKEYEPK